MKKSVLNFGESQNGFKKLVCENHVIREVFLYSILQKKGVEIKCGLKN